MQRNRRASRDPKRGKRVEIGFLDTGKILRMKRNKVKKSRGFGSNISGIPLKNSK